MVHAVAWQRGTPGVQPDSNGQVPGVGGQDKREDVRAGQVYTSAKNKVLMAALQLMGPAAVRVLGGGNRTRDRRHLENRIVIGRF